MPMQALQRYEHDRDGENGGAEHHEDGRRVIRPHEQRHAEPGHTGRAHAVDRDDEVEAGEDGREAGDEDGGGGGEDVGVEVVRRKRRGEGPAGVDAAEHEGREGKRAANEVEVPAQQVDLGEGEVLSADHDGDQEVPQRGGHGRHQEQEDHDDAVHGEELIVGVGRDQVRLRA